MSERAHLDKLVEKYESAPAEFQATSYWNAYKKPILETLRNVNLKDFRSGKHPILGTFGFNEYVFKKVGSWPLRFRLSLHALRQFIVRDVSLIPYSLDIDDTREMAYRHCDIYGKYTGSRSIADIGVCTEGSPGDLFYFNGKPYSIPFLSYYIRYCFVNKVMNFRGDEIIVELGSGSGHQVEILKKLYPGMTILCFDLPSQLYICETYLGLALGKDALVSSEKCIEWTDLSKIEKGKVHFFGNWQMPLLSSYSFDLFWNAASFGEMEPAVVRNYLSYIKNGAGNVYLLQAEHGKETHRVHTPIAFGDYSKWLDNFNIIAQEKAYKAHMRLKESGGYLHAVWKKK
ncbi:MAG: putative sugar O-methyltransferase [Crocinitomicaceae bacterium]|nr:putative sugar O-methyltransferase [Crocinitomicaceae bacterium]